MVCMNKHPFYLLLLLALCHGCASSSDVIAPDTPLQSGTVYYARIDGNAGSDGADSLLVQFNQQYLRFREIPSRSPGNYFVKQLTTGKTYQYVTYDGRRYGLKPPTSEEDYQLEKTTETKVIQGYTCSRQKLTFEVIEVDAWVTDGVAINFMPYADEFDGFVLEFTIRAVGIPDEQYLAVHIDSAPIPDDAVAPPTDATLMSYADFQEQVLGMGDSGIPSIKKDYPMGSVFPEFTATDIDGEVVDLRNLRGRVTVLNYWFIACKPCRDEMPALNRLVEQYSDEPVTFLAIAPDRTDKVEQFLRTKRFKYRHLPQATDLIQNYGVMMFPTHIILDKEGKVVGILEGATSTIGSDIDALIQQALKS